jgi:hypothetical protein
MTGHPEQRTRWFADAGWGAFAHYLTSAEMDAATWDQQVAAFNVDGLAYQLASARVPYFFITIGQNSGHYCAPNATYDRLTGIAPSRCSKRDLVADLAAALSDRGIKLCAYLPAGAPAAHPEAAAALGWEWGYEGEWPHWHSGPTTGKRLAAFQEKWEAIIREWAERWGDQVHAWWIDGCYFADDMYRHNDAPNFQSFGAALRAGNPDALVAYNPGVGTPIVCHSTDEDYTAGEISEALPVCPGPFIARGDHQARYHILSYLGSAWGTGSPRFSDDLAAAYTVEVVGKGGVVTWDIPIGANGLLPQPCVNQLAAIGARCAAARA